MNENQSSPMHHNVNCVNHAQSLMRIFRDILVTISSVELKGNSVFTSYSNLISICSWRIVRIVAVFLVQSSWVLFFGSSSTDFSSEFQDI